MTMLRSEEPLTNWQKIIALDATDRPNAGTVVSALLQAEKATRQQRNRFAIEDLLGDWQLYFSTSGKVKLGDQRLRGFYWPRWIPAQISFQPQADGAIEIANQIVLAGISLRLTGPAKYSPTKNLLGFDFTHLVVKVGGLVVYDGQFPSSRKGVDFESVAIGKLPFFAFFEANDRFIAARGRGGGLAIWVRTAL